MAEARTLNLPKGALGAPKLDEARKQKAVMWYGKKDIRTMDSPVPLVTDPEDVVLRVTSTAICGSDLHMYVGGVPKMQKGDIMGHEFMGIIESVGPKVQKLKAGDRVVVCFDIGCGHCYYCQKEQYSCCDTTNDNQQQEKLYGNHGCGIFGYSHLTGGYSGGQAEYVRVPFADTNCLQAPAELSDNQVLFLSDILPTAWHANELARVAQGDVVAIWGTGPVGILAAQCAFARGAARVIVIDKEQYRLDFATAKVPGVETINFDKQATLQALKEMVPDGPDVGIEAVGFHYTKSMLSKVQMALMMETDPADMLNEIIMAVRKGGRIGVVGIYVGTCNAFNMGAFMEKGMSMAAGQTPCQKYWPKLLDMVKQGKLNPSVVITHELPLQEAAKGYQIFNDKADKCMKVVLKTNAAGLTL